MSVATKRSASIAPWILVAVMLVVMITRDPVSADRQAANKAGASGSKTLVAAPNQDVVLLSKMIKTSTVEDLIFNVTAECSIVTNVGTVGDDDEQARGHIEAWITIDGRPVLTAPGDPEQGHVVFCDRTYRRQTLGFDDSGEEDDTINTFFSTRSTHGFNWVAFNLGNGSHLIELHGKLEADTTGDNAVTHAEAVIGNRTLIIEPAKFANNADLLCEPGAVC